MTSSKQVGGHPARLSRDRAPGNPFGLVEAIGGIAVGFLLSIVAVSIYVSLRGVGASSSGFGSEVVSLLLLWVGFVGAAVVATRLHDPSRAGIDPSLAGSGKLQRDFGVSIRPLVDIPLGVAVGIASQLGLIPLLELPLRPFVPNLTRQLGHPTTQLFGGVHGPGLVVLSILVCVGSPVVEELFFRGLWLRALLARFSPLGERRGPPVAIVVTGLVFAAVHFEALQFLGLAGFGIVLGYMAFRTSRLGPSVIAHLAFNATTVIYFVIHH